MHLIYLYGFLFIKTEHTGLKQERKKNAKQNKTKKTLFVLGISSHWCAKKITFILVTGQAAAKLHFIFRPCQVLTGQPITHFSAERIIVFMMGIFACIFAVRSGVVKRWVCCCMSCGGLFRPLKEHFTFVKTIT